MSCGFTPDVAHMIDQMVVETESTANQSFHAQSTKQNETQATMKAAHMNDKKQEGNDYDWTRTYEKWDTWTDPEDVARQEIVARERSEHPTKAQMGCNHDHSAEQKLMEMTTQAKLTACNEFRVLGNLFFKHGQYQRAAFHYHKALVYFEYIFADDDEAETDALKLKVLLNFAACRLKTMHLDDAVHHTNQALEIDHDNVKALYRRAQAYRLKDEFHLAQQDIARAIELSKAAEKTSSTDAFLLQEKKLLLAKILAYKLRTRKVSSAMFGNVDKAKASESSIDGTAPKFRDFDISDMTIKLSKTFGSASTSSCDDIQCLSTHQPSVRGLKELKTLVAILDS